MAGARTPDAHLAVWHSQLLRPELVCAAEKPAAPTVDRRGGEHDRDEEHDAVQARSARGTSAIGVERMVGSAVSWRDRWGHATNMTLRSRGAVGPNVPRSEGLRHYRLRASDPWVRVCGTPEPSTTTRALTAVSVRRLAGHLKRRNSNPRADLAKRCRNDNGSGGDGT
jgi:hypothetical protein